jgi:hypothetical protein
MAFEVTSSLPPCVGPAGPIDDDDRDSFTSWPYMPLAPHAAPSAGHGTLSHPGR